MKPDFEKGVLRASSSLHRGIRIHFAVIVIFILLLGLGVASRLEAQVVGATLSGTITDSSGAVVPKATVTIRNTATGIVRTVSTNETGFYTAPNVQPGDYQVTATAEGFASETAPITLTVGAQQTLSMTLKVGTSSQTVEITAAAPNINLVNSTLGGLDNESQIKELPLNGRSWSDLADLQPGVYSLHEQPNVSTRDRYQRGFGQQLSISGARPQQNNYRLDGISINDPTNGAPGSLLGGNMGVDAISEFSVLTTNYSTEYGRAAGGIINATTKSGTNQLHGDAYEFLRNSALDASNFFDVTKPPFRRNQFGGSLGGPIKKDKVFFFGDYEGLRQVLNITQNSVVPSKNARNGILAGGTPLPPNFVCPANSVLPIPGQSTTCVDNQATRFLNAFFPLPSQPTTGDTGSFIFGRPQITSENYFTIRSDQTLSSTDTLHETYMFDRSNSNEVDEFKNKNVQSLVHRQVLVLDESHIITPTFLNDVRIGVSRSYIGGPLGGTAINPAVADTSLGTVPGLSAAQIFINSNGITNFTGGLAAVSPQLDHWTAWQGYDDAFYSTGIHSIKFGASIEWDKWNRFYTPRAGGQWNFSSLASFLANEPQNLTADTTADPFSPTGGSCPFPQYVCLTPRGMRQTIFGVYFQDDMRVKSNLTINLGLRYEPTSVPAEVHGQVASMLAINSVVPGPGLKAGNPLYANNSLRNFDPRVGFAWDPFKTGKTSVRGGFGFYDQETYMNDFNNPFSSTEPFYTSIGISTLAQGDFPTNAYQKGLATLATGSYASSRVSFVQQHPGRAYVMQYNLSVQREITPNLTFLIGYVGSHGVRGMLQTDDINIVEPTFLNGQYLWPCEPFDPNLGCLGIGAGGQAARVNPTVGREAGMLWGNSAIYNGLQVQLTKRMAHGFQVQGSFAYQKSIDVASGAHAGDDFLNGISSLPMFNSRLTRAASDFDVPKVLSVNYLWDVPTPKSLAGLAGEALGGWQFGGIFSASDGTPFTALLVGDVVGENNTDPYSFPDRIRGAGCGSLVNPGNVNNYIKTQCFSAPAAVLLNGVHYIPFGNAGRNELRGPGLWDMDFSLVKNTYIRRISETFDVQFRAEAFNVFNHPNFASPVDNGQNFIIDPTCAIQCGGTEGIGLVSPNDVTSTGPLTSTTTTSRQMQFALKVIW